MIGERGRRAVGGDRDVRRRDRPDPARGERTEDAGPAALRRLPQTDADGLVEEAREALAQPAQPARQKLPLRIASPNCVGRGSTPVDSA